MTSTLVAPLEVPAEAVHRLAERGDEPGWLLDQRLRSWQMASRMGLPTRSEESWRYTDLSRIPWAALRILMEDGVPPPGGPVRAALLEPEPGTIWGAQVFARGGPAVRREVLPELQGQGVVVMDLQEAARAHAPLVREALEADPPPAHKLAALHRALWSGGLFLYVPTGVEVTLPVRSLTLRPGAEEGVVSRTLLVVDRGAAVSLVDEYGAAEDGVGPGGSLALTQVLLRAREGARVRYLALHRWDRATLSFAEWGIVLERDAHLAAATLALGGRLHSSEFRTRLAGPGAESRLIQLVYGEGDQHCTHYAEQLHEAPHTASDLLFKAALHDRAQSIFTGLIRIAKAAQRSDAYQASRSLLLSKQARANAIPKLEIEADDVRCTHGASVGSVDEDQRFYCMTRGLGAQEAERIIVEGFFEEVLQRVPEGPLRIRAARGIGEALGKGEER